MTDQPRRKYTAEFKREAVELVTKQGYSTAEAARNLGIRSNMLHRWRKQLSADIGSTEYGSTSADSGFTPNSSAKAVRNSFIVSINRTKTWREGYKPSPTADSWHDFDLGDGRAPVNKGRTPFAPTKPQKAGRLPPDPEIALGTDVTPQ